MKIGNFNNITQNSSTIQNDLSSYQSFLDEDRNNQQYKESFGGSITPIAQAEN